MLSTRQHTALVVTVAVVALAWCVVPVACGWRPASLGRTLRVCGSAAVGVVGIYGACIVLPRPMMPLAVGDPDLVAVDFHSHTNHSHDGRWGFTVERNRDWHRAGGWHVAYITDHLTVTAARSALAGNPHRAGDGTVLLVGVESRNEGGPCLVLGITPDSGAALDGFRPRGAIDVPFSPEHVVIATIPSRLSRVRRLRRLRAGVLVGIEVSDGSPRAVDQVQRQHDQLLQLAEERNLALVSASNNHGWSQTALAWTLLRIPGWRQLEPAVLDRRIRDQLRAGGRHATRVVTRSPTRAMSTPLALAATVPLATWDMWRRLGRAERVSWVAWAWGLPLLGSVWRSRRRTRGVHGKRGGARPVARDAVGEVVPRPPT